MLILINLTTRNLPSTNHTKNTISHIIQPLQLNSYHYFSTKPQLLKIQALKTFHFVNTTLRTSAMYEPFIQKRKDQESSFQRKDQESSFQSSHQSSSTV